MMNNLKHVFSRYVTLLKKYPVTSQGIQTSVLMGAGDVIAQKVIEERKEINLRRFCGYSLLGLVYVGPALRIWYGKLDKLFPSAGKQLQYKKVLLDQGVFAPTFLASIMGLTTVLNTASIQDVKKKLRQDYTDILMANYKVWPAVMIINFSLVPLHYQVLVTQSVAVLWNIYFSWKANQPIIEVS